MKTKEGKAYHDKFFKVMESTLNKAMEGCLERTPDTKDDQHPAEFLFIIAADGRLKNLVYSTNIPFGQCVGPKLLRAVKNVPRPPGDNWVVLVGLGNQYHRLNRRPIPDEPRIVSGSSQVETFDKSIAPYVAKARATYASAKKRFAAGLPKGQQFFVQVPLYDGDRRENCFVAVENIRGGKITGTINSHVDILTNYKQGQRVTFLESQIFNWLISRADGTEEGNYVGKFLDHYKPQ